MSNVENSSTLLPHEIASAANTEKSTVFSEEEALAGIQYYFEMRHTFREEVRNYLLSEVSNSRSQSERVEPLTTALEDIHFAPRDDQDPEKLDKEFEKRFDQDWGEESESIKNLHRELLPKLEETQNTLLNKTENFTKLKKFIVGQKLARKFYKLSPDEQVHFLKTAGYTTKPGEVTHSIETASKLQVATGTAAGLTALGAISLGGITSFLEPLPDQVKLEVFALTYLLSFISLVGTGIQYTRLLNNPIIKTSPNLIQTVTYFLSRKNDVITASSLPAQTLLLDIFYNGILSFQANGGSEAVARNLANCAIYLTSSLVSQIFLNKNSENKE